MFEFIRQNRNLFSIIFIIMAVGMVVSLFGTGTTVGTGGASGEVARVKGEKILVQDFARAFDNRWRQTQEAMERQFQGSKADPQTRQFMEALLKAQVNPAAVLDGLLQARLITAIAKEQGVKIPPSAVRYTLSKVPIFQKDGKFDPLLYKQYVARPGEYEKQLREELYRDALFYNMAVSSAYISSAQFEEAKLLRKKYNFDLLEVKPASVNAPNITEQEVTSLLADQAAQVELKSFYESHRSDYETPATVRARHILITDKDGAQKKATEIREEIIAGKLSFEEAAKKFSSDKSNANNGGDLGYFEYKSMDPKFSEAAFALSAKEPLSGVIQSSFGYHLIQFVDRKEEVKRSFEEVQKVLAQRFLEERSRRNFAQKILADAVAANSLSAANLNRLGAKWEQGMVWDPLAETVGTVNVSNLDIKLLVSLSKPGQIYPRVVSQGPSFFLLKLKNVTEASEKKEEILADDLANRAQTYVDRTFKELQNSKKIYKDEKILTAFEKQIGTN